MEDRDIISLYFDRDETAIAETDKKYGALCRGLAMNILGLFHYSEECVADTWHRTWCAIPPQCPQSLRCFVARITRNLSISRLRRDRAFKRGGGRGEELLSELGDCVSDRSGDPVAESERRELARSIDRWLDTLGETDRYVFVRRYWYGDAVKDIASSLSLPRCAQRLHRLRLSLRAHLEKEGFSV